MSLRATFDCAEMIDLPAPGLWRDIAEGLVLPRDRRRGAILNHDGATLQATLEVVIQGLQAREIPVAQDPTSGSEADEDVTDAPDARAHATLRSG